MCSDVRVLIAGTGQMASAYVKVLRAIPTAELVGVVGRSWETVTEFAAKEDIFFCSTSLRAAIQKTKPDAVVAAVSLTSIQDVYEELIGAEPILLLEKPFGVDLNCTIQLVRLCENRKQPVFVAMNRRFYSSSLLLQDQLAQLQGPRFIQIADQQCFGDPRDSGYPEFIVKRWPYANSIHLLDLGRQLARGSPISTLSSGWNPSMDQPSLLTGRIDFDSGDVITYQALWNQPGPWSVSVTCEREHLEMRPLEQLKRREVDGAWVPFAVSELDITYKPGVFLQTSALLDAVSGKPVALPTPSDVLQSVEILHHLYEGHGTELE